MRSVLRSLFTLSALALLATGCKPTYPKCDKDDHCKEKGEVCVNGTCQDCRDDAGCAKRGENFVCVTGRCEPKKECTTNSDCAKVGEGLICKENKCVAECTATTDCGTGKKCEQNKCVAECGVDVDCGPGRFCVDGACSDTSRDGTRISSECRPMDASGGQIVATQTVHFDFDQFDLTVEARKDLDKSAACLKQAGQVHIVLEGHADERGTQEYNLALGEKRAAAVQAYLRNQGLDPKRMTIRSKGENEPVCSEQTEACWAKNRRVDFIQSIR